MNKNIDSLIDSAFEADKNRIPKQPASPPASLLEQLGTTASSVTAPLSQSAAIGGVGASLTMKFLLSGIVVGSVAIGSYFFLKTSAEQPASQPPAVTTTTTDSSKSGLQADSAIARKENKKRLDSNQKTVKNAIPETVRPLPVSENDLDFPKEAKIYTKDSTRVPISRKH